MADKDFGNRLQTIRKIKNYTQQQLADLLGLKNKTTLSSWEVGKSEPDIAAIKDLCSVLEISLNELFDFHQETRPMCSTSQINNKPKRKSLDELIEEEDKKRYAKIAGYGGGVKTIELGEKEEQEEYYALVKNNDEGYKRIDMTKDEFTKIKDMLDIIRK